MEELRVLLQTLDKRDMAKRIPRRPDQSLRDFPIYTIPQASFYLAIPESTLRYWVVSHPVWKIAGGDKDNPLLSFRDLAQAYYIEMARKHFRKTLSKMRDVIEEASRESRSEYPLIQPNIRLFLNHIFMDKPARGTLPRRMINLSNYGQLGIPEVVEPLSTRFLFNVRGQPVQLYPWRLWTGKAEDKKTPVSLNPDVLSGRLVISGTRVPVEVIAHRKAAGESVPHLSKEYQLSEDLIEQALEHLAPPEKKAA